MIALVAMIFFKVAAAVALRNSAAMKVADCQRTKSRTADRRSVIADPVMKPPLLVAEHKPRKIST
jgi:hypothetical protein